MIQRIQSIFLVGVALTLGALFYLPIFEKTNTDKAQYLRFDAYAIEVYENAELIQSENTYFILILAFIGLCLAFISLFSFKDRMKQMKLGLAITFISMALLGIMAYYSYKVADPMLTSSQKGYYGLGLFVPVVALILNRLATFFIKKDEDLVRSMDRIR